MFERFGFTLAPGTGPSPNGSAGSLSSRPDWTPDAQPPDAHGVMAHTPDPAKYHGFQNRTVIPRSKRDYGSRGFSTEAPVVMQLEPSLSTCKGGIQIDLSRVTPAISQQAARVAQENPDSIDSAYQLLGQLAAAGGRPGEPARQGNVSAMPHLPQFLPTQPLGSPSGPAAAPSTAPTPAFLQQPLPGPYSAFPAPVASLGSYSAPADSYPVPVSAPSPTPASTADGQLPLLWGQINQMQAGMQQLLQGMQVLAGRLDGSSSTAEPPMQNRPPLSDPGPARRAESWSSLAFLSRPPVRPELQVAIDLRAFGGRLRMPFHGAAVGRGMISLVYDTRYDSGSRIIPPETPQGETILLAFPQYGDLKVQVIALDRLHLQLDCLDILNFCVAEPEAQEEILTALRERLERT